MDYNAIYTLPYVCVCVCTCVDTPTRTRVCVSALVNTLTLITARAKQHLKLNTAVTHVVIDTKTCYQIRYTFANSAVFASSS